MIQEAQSQKVTIRIQAQILDSAARALKPSALLLSSRLYLSCCMPLSALLNSPPDLLQSTLALMICCYIILLC